MITAVGLLRVAMTGHAAPSTNVSFLVLLHVHIQAGLLGKGCLAQLALVGLLARVDAFVHYESVLGGEALVAHFAVVRGLTQVLPHVRHPQVSHEVGLGAELTLKLLALSVNALNVAVQPPLVQVGFPADVADVGLLTRLRAVLAPDVLLQDEALPKRGATMVTGVPLRPLCGDVVHARHVHLQLHLLSKHLPAAVAQVTLAVGEEKVALHVGQAPATGAHAEAGERALGADAHVAARLLLGGEVAEAQLACVGHLGRPPLQHQKQQQLQFLGIVHGHFFCITVSTVTKKL